VLDGKMEFTIAGETKIYEKGDWYYIPEGVEHAAKFLTRVYVIDMFDTNDRYKIKTS
jgi:quercetin dioxygenase-like cupin family protein